MNFTRTLTLLLLLVMTGTALAGEIRLSVAASMKDAVGEIAAAYEKGHQGERVLGNYGGSGALAKQIENGAPADIYISANREWVDYLKVRKLLDAASISVCAYNSLVFAGQGKAAGMKDLPALKRIAIGSPRSVPAGEYAMAAMQKAGIAGQMEKKLVMARDVREALVYAERGEVDGAFVYRTDALLARQARILFTVPPELHERVTYPMGLTTAGAKSDAARSFYRYLGSKEARTILEKYGFTLH